MAGTMTPAQRKRFRGDLLHIRHIVEREKANGSLAHCNCAEAVYEFCRRLRGRVAVAADVSKRFGISQRGARQLLEDLATSGRLRAFKNGQFAVEVERR